MPTNDFIGFASAGSANIMSQADYAAAAEQTDGVQPGMASSALANKIWRQGANMAAALGEIIKAQGIDALDNGDIATLSNNIVSALSAFLLSLSGGTMTGTIESTVDTILKKSTTTGSLIVLSGNSSNSNAGANIVLRGGEHTSNPGEFTLHAGNSNGYKQLVGKPDGTLTWDGNDVAIIQTGTWTPILAGETTEGALSYSTRDGIYVKIGRLVLLQCKLVVSAVSTMPTGYALIRGLPYNISSAALLPLRGIGGDSNCARKVVFAANNANNSNQFRIIGINPSSIATTGQIENLKWSSTNTGADNIKFANSNPFIEFNITGCYLTSA